MENPQDQTIKTYRDHFKTYEDRTVKEMGGPQMEWVNSFASFLPEGASILEIGSATARDAKYLKSKGFNVLCTDVVPEALEKLKKEGFETDEYDFRSEFKKEWHNKFDGLFANGVLHHATKDDFEKIIERCLEILKDEGVIAFTVKNGSGEEVSNDKMDSPRYFKYYTKEELTNTLEKFKFKILSLKEIDNNKWLAVILKKIN